MGALMPEADVRSAVVHVLAVVSGNNEHTITDAQRLFEDLGMAADLRRALAPGFARVAQKTNPTAKITRLECEKLLTVKAAIGLVKKRATAQ